jgi:ArsR family transcriptional regulator, arsenate/arsenite/antimonite-responsive transcriptional repressor
MAKRSLEVIGKRSGEASGRGGILDEDRIVALGRALSDPIRVRMLGMMAEGRSCCCDLPDLGVPADENENPGTCICEFEDYSGMGQSRVSYHMRRLKEAGLVREERRGKWSFYSFDREAAGRLLAETENLLGVKTRVSTGV